MVTATHDVMDCAPTDSISKERHAWQEAKRESYFAPRRKLNPGFFAVAPLFDLDALLPPDPFVGDAGVFVRNRDLRFAVMSVLPPSAFPTSRRQHRHDEVLVSFVTSARLRNGAVTIRQRDAELTVNFRQDPDEVSAVADLRIPPVGRVLDANQHPELLTVFNRLWEGLLSAGMRYRSDWQENMPYSPPRIRCGNADAVLQREARQLRRRIRDKPDEVSAEERERYARIADSGLSVIPSPREWFPVPYCRIPKSVSMEDIISQELTSSYEISTTLRDAFIADLADGMPVTMPVNGRFIGEYPGATGEHKELRFVVEGLAQRQVIAVPVLRTTRILPGLSQATVGATLGYDCSPPAAWKNLNGSMARWEYLRGRWDAKHSQGCWSEKYLRARLAAWLHRQIVYLDGQPALPYGFIARWATHHSAVELTAWSVKAAGQYLSDRCQCIVPPPVPQANCWQTEVALPHCVELRMVEDPSFCRPSMTAV